MLASITGDMLENSWLAYPTPSGRSRLTFGDAKPDRDSPDLGQTNATLVVVSNAALKAQCQWFKTSNICCG